tara:strand:+ start:343 stop:2415 length:2073 start_codon:yes stop_codon:yes gene_type:complete
MQKLQLYIGTERVDLFKDETVSLTQTIQNVKDISKIFTEFSKTFSLPASKVNNKIFKHYYNFDIDGGFDARNKVAGKLELNTIPFKEGFIRLEGVDLKKNVPHTYKITFFGNTINLKDVLGDDQLSTLGGLNTSNSLDYTFANIKSKLTNNPTTNICAPLITHTRRLYFDSAGTGDGNVDWDSATSVNGVYWNDLKFAIRLQAIIDAIEAQTNYGLTFSNDFFNDSSNTAFYNLWMWLHRKKGSVEPTGQLSLNFVQVQNLGKISGNTGYTTEIAGILTLASVSGNIHYVQTDLDITPTANNVDYSIRVFRNGAQIAERLNVQGPQQLFATSSTRLGAGSYTIEIASIAGITFNTNNIKWTIAVADLSPGGGGGADLWGNGQQFSTSSTIEFIITQQIPEMSIIDFLTGIFKMFNLTAYVDNTGTIVVRTLDSYYAAGKGTLAGTTPWNIDQYLDVTKSTVDVALPFREIKFAYKGLGTFLAKQFYQVNNLTWGTNKYTLGDDVYDAPTAVYNVQLPFEHVMYERLFNVATNAATSVQYGYFTDDNQQPYYGSPLIFYAVYIQNGDDISLKESANDNDQINDYIIPSNSLAISASTSKVNINFGAMVNEYDPNNPFTDTLFSSYYETYIADVFNLKTRLTKVQAMLPLKMLYNLQLNDKIQFQQNNYKINSITTDLTTGKSSIELLNVVQ